MLLRPIIDLFSFAVTVDDALGPKAVSILLQHLAEKLSARCIKKGYGEEMSVLCCHQGY